MKYMSEMQKIRHLLRAKKEEKRKARRAARKRMRTQGSGPYTRIDLSVPSSFDLRQGLKETLEFFRRLRKVILLDRRIGLIDFSSCVKISAGADLILAAEVDRCRNLRHRDGKPTVTGTYPHDDGMQQFLDDLGFFDLIKVKSPLRGKKPIAKERFIAMRSGYRDRGKPMKEIADIVTKGAVRLDNEARDALYMGLLEAMNNVTAHAYPREARMGSTPVLPGRWWAAGHWDNEGKEIGTLIYDQGVGIPETLPKHGDVIQNILRRLQLGDSDADRIRAAMEIGKSRVGANYRGKGMASLRHGVEKAGDGHLLILSGAGGYLYRSNSEEKMFTLPAKIGGTFIEWRIRDRGYVRW